jgi:hypothetical protein
MLAEYIRAAATAGFAGVASRRYPYALKLDWTSEAIATAAGDGRR